MSGQAQGSRPGIQPELGHNGPFSGIEATMQRNKQIAKDNRVGATRSRHHDDAALDQLITSLASFAGLGPGKEFALVHVHGQLNIHRAPLGNG
jgi:hypothetical protein